MYLSQKASLGTGTRYLLDSSASFMRFAHFDLLQRVVESHDRARHGLSTSDMPSQRLPESGGLGNLSLAENHPGGSPELQSILAGMYGGDREDYVVTAGPSEANFAGCAALLSPGDSVLVERPAYQPLEAIPHALTGRVEHLVRQEEDGFGLTEEQVREAVPAGLKILVLSNRHNPTGAALDGKTVRGIADLAVVVVTGTILVSYLVHDRRKRPPPPPPPPA